MLLLGETYTIYDMKCTPNKDRFNLQNTLVQKFGRPVL